MNTSFTALVLAGDRRPGDPVAQAAGVSCKALVPVAGKPMVLRVLDALEASQEVGGRLLCGPPRSALAENARLHALIADGRVQWLAPGPTPSTSAWVALHRLPESVPVLLTTADHALLASRMVDYFCTQARASDCDVVAGLAPHRAVAAAFPDSRRTVIKLRDGGYCGCNLFAFLTPRGRIAAGFWRRIERERKKPLRLIGAIGWIAVLRYLLGRLSLDEAVAMLSRRLGIRIGYVILPFPEAAVDVDTVADWRFVQAQANDGTL